MVKSHVLNLPQELHAKFFSKLTSTKDCISFGAVCRSWKSVYDNNRKYLPKQNPILMLSIKGLSHKKQTQFYNVSTNTILTSSLEEEFTGDDNVCIGSAGSWVAVHADGGEVILLNPFVSIAAGNKVTLPFIGSHVQKVVLSASPNLGSNYVALAVNVPPCDGFDVYKSEVDEWVSLDSEDTIYDGIWFQNQFYMLKDSGVFKFDPSSSNLEMTSIAPKLDLDDNGFRYLVELNGELLQVIKMVDEDMNGLNYTYDILVYKFDERATKWIKIKDLGEWALFVGSNTSLPVLASDFPGCKPNSVYYSDGPHDFGVYNMQDGRIQPFSFDMDMDNVEYALPCWLEPSLIGCAE